jgi:hypothetical protein
LVTRGDKILISLGVAATVLIWAGLRYLPDRSSELVAVVRINGQEVARLPVGSETLSQTTIAVPQGEATIEHGQGKVRVMPLDHDVCPNEICWRTGWISYPGQSIVCVPNRMVITLEGTGQEIDSVARR